jgi:hypothetical protein
MVAGRWPRPEEDAAFFVQQLGASEARRYSRFKRRSANASFTWAYAAEFAVSRLMSLPPDVLGVVRRTGTAPQLVLGDSELATQF